MCALHSVLPNDYTLRYYAGKVATFCSICLCKREACLTPASWLWDIIPHNSLTAWLACGAAGFEWQAGAAKQAFGRRLGRQAMRKPAIPSLVLCSWGRGALWEVMASPLQNNAAKPLPKEAYNYSHGKTLMNCFVIWNSESWSEIETIFL